MLLAAAREFYLEILGGREIRRPQPAGDARLLFMVGGLLIETGPACPDGRGTAVMWADNVEDVASRCWDAGFTVLPSMDAPPMASVIVVDPFGRRIEIVSVETSRAARVVPFVTSDSAARRLP